MGLPDTATVPAPVFSLPPLYAFSFAPLLFALCLLLQPIVPARTSRILRLALLAPTAWLAWSSTFRYRIEPVEWGIAANFRWGIFSPYFLMKTLEWCLVTGKERERELAWVGFDGKTEEKLHEADAQTRQDGPEQPQGSSTALSNGNGGIVAPRPVHPVQPSALSPPSSDTPQQLPTPSPSPPFSAIQPPSISASASSSSDKKGGARLTPLTHSRTVTLRARQRAHPLRILADATHLLTAMRGVGYAWGPPARSLHPPAKSHADFFWTSLPAFAQAHAVATVCLALQVYDRDGLLGPRLAALPFLSAPSADALAGLTSRLCVGVSLYFQMLVGFHWVNLTFFLLAYATNSVLGCAPGQWGWTWRAKFDVREYPGLFDRPFGMMGQGGVSAFWGKRWHALFRSPFTALGFNPSVRFARRLGLPSAAGKLLGAFVVFGLSAWMHWQALYSARYSLTPTASGLAFAAAQSPPIPLSSLYPPPLASLSFIERHGTWIFFLGQPVAVLLETIWVAATRRKIGGLAGRAWTVLWLVVFGQAVAGRSWLALGLVHGLPPIDRWSWHRWLLPSHALAPMPVMMRHP